MKKQNLTDFLRFFIPSLFGIFLFITPIKYNGEISIPIAAMASTLLNFIAKSYDEIILILILLSCFITLLHKMINISFIEKTASLKALFSIKGFWFYIRILSGIFICMIYFSVGPEFIVSHITGRLIVDELMPLLVCIFLLASLLLPLLLNFGLMDFFGVLLIKFMRPIFNLPGRSALDCVASWLGDGSIGVLMTSKQYEEGYYSKREATVIATTFSAVSITFSLVVISEVGLSHMFLQFFLTVTVAGIFAAIVVPKLPPLSKVLDIYNIDRELHEDIPEGHTAFQYAVASAILKAKDSASVKGFALEGFLNVLDMWLGVLPVILTFGTIALAVAQYTKIFEILGLPFMVIYMILGVPEAKEASATVIVGFADMFLPSVIAASRISSEMTRFIVAATSVTQLIYLSEIGSIIMGSKIPVSLKNLFIIFLQRTIITLPIIVIFARLFF